VDIQLNLSTETVTQAHATEPLCVEPHVSVREVLRLLKEQRTGSVLVCRDCRAIGIFTERDALRLMASHAVLDTPIENVMTPEPMTLRAEDTVGTAISRMSTGGYRRLPIVDDQGRLQGLVKVSGIMRYLVEHFPKIVYNQPPVTQTPPQNREGA
jgi:CBS domain-containing protein